MKAKELNNESRSTKDNKKNFKTQFRLEHVSKTTDLAQGDLSLYKSRGKV